MHFVKAKHLSLPLKQSKELGLARGNLMITILILVVLCALFFIPELISLTKKIPGSHDSWFTSSEEPTSNAQTVAVDDGIISDLGPLDSLLYKLNRGSEIDSSAVRASYSGKVTENDTNAESSSSNSEDNKITWQALESRSVVRTLKENKKQLTILLREIHPKYENAKIAIRNMINGIEYVLDGAEEEMSARDVATYLANLDASLERALLTDKVDRETFMRWRRLSYGSVFNSTELNRQKTIITFNPKFTLAKVVVSHPSTESNQIDPTKEPLVYIESYVKGDDVAEILIYRNGQRLKKAFAELTTNEFGFRKIPLRHLPATGI
ncbi:MAG: hypothetical protein KDD56_10795, partial [Bdellovibrionales bacterium]|nr:hypothetical protein [Bdellovibrionales bacterium]